MLPLAVSVAIAFGLTAWLQHARGFGVVAAANPDVVTHKGPIPLLGGVAIMLGLLCGLAVHGFRFADATPFVLGLTLVVGLGLFKDLRQRDLSPRFQLAIQTIAVLLLALAEPDVAWPLLVAQVLFGVVVINGLNFIDVTDGLASTVTILCALGVAAVLGVLRLGDPWPPVFLAGATAGFLVFNRPKATIFMGDVGSFGIALTLLWFVHPLWSAAGFTRWVGVAVLCAPVIELLITAGTRVRRGRSPFVGDDLHPSLRLLRRGISPTLIIAAYGSVAAATVLSALAMALSLRT